MLRLFTWFILASAFAMSSAQAWLNADQQFQFKPAAGFEAKCARAGFVGNFRFIVDKKYPNLADLVFVQTHAKLGVIHDRGPVWRTSIMGGWSETTMVDFSRGVLQHSHSEPGHSRSCEGTFRPLAGFEAEEEL